MQYITLHYSALHYITVHYTTYMHRTWCTKSYVTKGAQVLSHQDLHTYSTLQYSIYSTLHYSTLHYITVKCSTVHYTTVHYITVQYIHAKDLEIVCHQRGTSPKSSERTYIYCITLKYSTLHPNTFFNIFNLFTCFKILSVYKSKEKMENHRFLWNIFFWRWAQVLSHHFFNEWLEDFDPTTG